MRKFLRENALILAFCALFLACVWGQALAGMHLFNQQQSAHGLAPLSVERYVTKADFLEAMFENWQAAVLQLAVLIVLGSFLRQRGAPHSKRLGAGGGRSHKTPGAETATVEWRPVRAAHKRGGWLHRNSLSFAFFLLFAITFALHAVVGTAAYRREQMLAGQAMLTFGSYLGSAKFWFLTMQTWEAEFMAMALYLFLSIYLRQQGSPESKPPDASDEDTGDPNQ